MHETGVILFLPLLIGPAAGFVALIASSKGRRINEAASCAFISAILSVCLCAIFLMVAGIDIPGISAIFGIIFISLVFWPAAVLPLRRRKAKDKVHRIRLMADYQCHPLWRDSGDQVGNIDPADLNISPELIQKLRDWADLYDRTLNLADPVNSGFGTKLAEEAFNKTGRELSDQLIRELGAGFAVRYQEMS